ncbi:RNI-like protein [Neoconidiobolus thromboides FSU 785]|nr:RNI-like protein [Neoconidiobolus thromboides FSU 785]
MIQSNAIVNSYRINGHKRKASREVRNEKLVNSYLRSGQTMRAIMDGDLTSLNENDIKDLNVYFGNNNSGNHLDKFILNNRTLNHVMSKVLTKIIQSPSLGINLLILNSISIDFNSLNHIILSIAKSKSLKKLVLKQIKFDRRIVQPFFESLQRNKASQLSTILIENISLDKSFCKAFATYFPKNLDLKALSLSNCSIDNDSFKSIAPILHNNNTIQELNLSHNLIGANGTDILYQTLIFNHTLAYLSLEGNNIGPRGCERLASCLELNSSIKYLNLNYNNIGDLGVRHLYSVLKDNKTLHCLKLAQNRLSEDSCIPLKAALLKNHNLSQLDLSNNMINSNGGVILSEGLKGNQGIQELLLNNNNLGNQGISSMLQAMSVNKTLQHIDLKDNNIQDPTIYSNLISSLFHNQQLKVLNINYDFEGWESIYSEIQSILINNFLFYKEKVASALEMLTLVRLLLCGKKSGMEFSNEILEYIAIGADKKRVLSSKQCHQILKFGRDKTKLNEKVTKLNYLKFVFGNEFNYYPVPVCHSALTYTFD